jgi:P-type Ca2+ transporter type 2C
MPSQPIYALRPAEVYPALASSAQGLAEDQLEERRALYGRNILTDPPKPNPARKWLKFSTHPMALLLWTAGLISILASRPIQGFLIWIVVLVNASFSFWRDHQAERAIQTLTELLPEYARVMRGGKEVETPTAEIVPGDVLVLAEGDHIPADARVVEEYGLRTNNATLSGESMPARKLADASLLNGLTEVERPNLVFAGTSVVSGTGRAVVYATGMLTQFGRITRLTQTVEDAPGQLQRGLERTTRMITLVAIAIGAIVFLESISEIGMPLSEAILLAVGILVAAVPEGLVPTVTLALAMAVQRLASHGVLVKKLSKVETLGAISVICTDKSGTLTQNQMTVREIWVSGERLTVSGVGYEPTGQFIRAGREVLQPERQRPIEKSLAELLRGGLLCNNARLRPPSLEHPFWTSLGDHTEAALRVAAVKGCLSEEAESRGYPRVHELPFDARRKRMSTVHRSGGGEIAYVKGAPREILQLCSQVLFNGAATPLSGAVRADILATNDAYARSGLRVLAIATRSLPNRTGAYSIETVERDLTFLGLVGMMDPPRPEVAQAMQVLRQAGIRMVMITGDYGLTAESIARRVGMISQPSPRIVSGSEFEKMGEGDLAQALKQETIFARMAPENKLRLVDFLQKQGEVVAVIGDGVNDAPALRKADIGFAMGKTGTDVAREAADVILVDDQFGEVARAIEEGRAVFDNLRKFITYIFASNVPEIMPFILTALFHIPLALTVIQILAIDLGTDLLPALALGMEKPEPDIMQRPPHRRDQPLIDRGLLVRAYGWLGVIETAFCYLGFFWVYDRIEPGLRTMLVPGIGSIPVFGLGFGTARQDFMLASTIFQACVVMAQIGNAFACRTEKGQVHKLGWLSNPYLLAGIGFDVVFLLGMIYFQPVAQIFSHIPLPPQAWILLVLIAPSVFILEKIRKVASFRLGLVRSKKRQGAVV